MGVALLGAQAARANTIEAGDQAFTTLANWNAAATATGEDTFDTAPGQGNAALYSNASGFTDTLGIDYVGSFDTGNYYLEIVNPTLSRTSTTDRAPAWIAGSPRAAVRHISRPRCPGASPPSRWM